MIFYFLFFLFSLIIFIHLTITAIQSINTIIPRTTGIHGNSTIRTAINTNTRKTAINLIIFKIKALIIPILSVLSELQEVVNG